jgi:hypothetical protein
MGDVGEVGQLLQGLWRAARLDFVVCGAVFFAQETIPMRSRIAS